MHAPRIRTTLCIALATALALASAAAEAGVLDRVRRDGVLQCGAEPRTGVAEDRGDGTLGGVAVDQCRAVAASVLGPHGRIVFSLYRAARDFDAVRDGREELSFLTPDAIADQDLGAWIAAGPTVFTVRLSLLVPPWSPARQPLDLAGQPICFMIGSDAQAALDASFRTWHAGFLHMGYEEADEMADAYAARRCTAMAGEATELGRLARGDATGNPTGRILAPPLGRFAIVATTPRDDRRWSALVAAQPRANQR